MCGRFTLRTPLSLLTQQFLFPPPAADLLTPRYNIAPTQEVAAVRADGHQNREIVLLRWGLIPSWAKEKSIGNRLINARSETVDTKPSFRTALKRQRCLILADGFYEWKKQEGGKQPYHITLADGEPFAFAGLWERWQRGGPRLESCTIVTTEANDAMRSIHERMPVILSPNDYALWLDPSVQDAARVRPLLAPYSEAALRATPVSTYVNSPRNDSPECVVPLS